MEKTSLREISVYFQMVEVQMCSGTLKSKSVLVKPVLTL